LAGRGLIGMAGQMLRRLKTSPAPALPPSAPVVAFWPNYSDTNPYQRLLYAPARSRWHIVAADLDAARHRLRTRPDAAAVIFHLHWTNQILRNAPDTAAGRVAMDRFLADLAAFRAAGGRLVWTVHNAVAHDARHPELEAELSARIAALADLVHIHATSSLPEIAAVFAVDSARVRVIRHGHFLGVYPDTLSRSEARRQLGLAADDEVVLFTGQVRPYKGVEDLVKAMALLWPTRPRLRLVIAGGLNYDPRGDIAATLPHEQARQILWTSRFLADEEMQLYLRAADVAAYPYRRILTSGSILLALSFGVPVVSRLSGMTAEVLDSCPAGRLIGREAGPDELAAAIASLLDAAAEGDVDLAAAARARAAALPWQDIGVLFDELAGPPFGNSTITRAGT
jgi:glycosyltransferase involved in cell wall biosynthesis